jgi:hypothetical protein
MPTSLRNTLDALATQFATQVLHAIRAASLEDILSESGSSPARRAGAAPTSLRLQAAKPRGKAGRLARRSPEDIGAVIEKIVGLLEKHSSGLRAEEIRGKLGLQAKELPRPIADALAAKRIVKEGEKRATTYFAREAKRKG